MTTQKTLTQTKLKEQKGPYELPEGWKWVRLGDVAEEIKSGGTPSRKIKKYWVGGKIPWVKISDIKEDDFYINDTEEKITEEGLKNSSAKLFKKGTVLYTIFATIGRAGILNIDATTNQAIVGITLKQNYDRKFIAYILRQSSRLLKEIGRGNAQNNINQRILKDLLLPIPFRNNKPDLETQKRIVANIEEIFSRVDKAIKLREEALNKTEKLFQMALEEVFREAKEDKEGWKWVRLVDLVLTEKGKRPKNLVKEKKENTIPYLTADYFRERNIKQYSDDITKKVEPNDLLMLWDGSKSGDVFVSDIEGILASTMVKIIPKEQNVLIYYLFYILKSKFSFLNNQTTGSGIPHVSREIFQNLLIPFPFRNNKPYLEKQKQIVERLDKLNEKIKKMKELQQIELEKLKKLKEQILYKAFRGQLI